MESAMPAASIGFRTRLTVFAFACLASAAAQPAGAQAPEPIRFARYAGIANDGRVAFTYQDDIWMVNADGSVVGDARVAGEPDRLRRLGTGGLGGR